MKIAIGTDAGVFPHGQNAHEFELMVKAGMSPVFALQAATIHAAELLKREKDFGSVTPGKLADLIALSGNPLEDISILKRVSCVIKEGIVYKRGGKAVEFEPPWRSLWLVIWWRESVATERAANPAATVLALGILRTWRLC